MTSINLIPDDLGVQRLRRENSRPASTGSVTAVDPYPAEQPGQSHPERRLATRRMSERRQGERRRGERRREQVAVLLDTRSRHDRRSARDRRRQAGQESSVATRSGLDLYA
jgi:hypothetical protein